MMSHEETHVPDMLTATDAALYLGTSVERFWRHVREKRVKPCAKDSGSWLFSRTEIDKAVDSYYKESTRYRNVAGIVYIFGGIALYGAARCLVESYEVVRIVYCFSCALIGVGIRGLWLAPFPLPHPSHAYTFFYWVFALVGGLVAFVVGTKLFGTAWQFYAGTAVVAFVIGFLIHPNFWPMGSWARSK